jgi:cellobiose phosphorylase
MGRAGIKGKGVSVWLSIAFVRAAKMLSQMAKWLGRDEDSAEAAERAAVMEGRVNEFGWDGDRYIYAISDDRILIGAKENEEGSIFALPQLWSVFADFDKERALIAMETLERELNTDIGLLVSAPPYTEFLSHVGTMCQKFPGLHENGGAYLHGAVWKLAVDSMLGRNDKVEEGLRKILPDDHTYYETCGEPYAMFNSYLGKQTGYRAGKPGQSWRTASGQWLLYSVVRFVYGLQPEFEGLLLRPCLPPAWKDCSVTKQFRDCEYRIHYVQKDEGGCNRIEKLTINGVEANPDQPIRPIAGETLDIEVTLVK